MADLTERATHQTYPDRPLAVAERRGRQRALGLELSVPLEDGFAQHCIALSSKRKTAFTSRNTCDTMRSTCGDRVGGSGSPTTSGVKRPIRSGCGDGGPARCTGPLGAAGGRRAGHSHNCSRGHNSDDDDDDDPPAATTASWTTRTATARTQQNKTAEVRLSVSRTACERAEGGLGFSCGFGGGMVKPFL